MFTKLLISACLALPVISRAQFIPGAYILMENPKETHRGHLKYDESSLFVVGEHGKRTKFKPTEVYYAKTADNRRYISVNGFEALSHFGTKIMGNTLVELVDSGRVWLLRYDYTTTNGNMGVISQFFYLAKPVEAATAVALNGYVWTNRGKKFYASLAPYAVGRPDLQQLLTERQLTSEQVPAFFRAINSGQPLSVAIQDLSAEKLAAPVPVSVPASALMPASPSHYEILKQQALAKRAKKAATADSTRR